MNKNFTPPSKKPTEKIEEKLNIEPDRHFVVALQTGHCLDFHNKCSFVKFERRDSDRDKKCQDSFFYDG